MSRDAKPGTELQTRGGERPGALVVMRRALPVALGIGALVLGTSALLRVRGIVFLLALVGLVAIAGVTLRLLTRLFEPLPAAEGSGSDASKQLKRSLSRAQYFEAVDPALAEKALAQFDQNEDRIRKFREVLRAKFEPTELTFGRYLSAAEQLYAAIAENLQDVAVMLANLDSLSVREARKELGILERFATLSDDERRTMEGLRDRLAIAERTEAEIRSRLAYNEAALTELDRVNLALSSIKTSKSASNIDLEATMDELRELAERAKKYSL